MSKLVEITLRRIQESIEVPVTPNPQYAAITPKTTRNEIRYHWQLEVTRGKTYDTITTEDIDTVKKEIQAIAAFAMGLKTEEEKQAEESNKLMKRQLQVLNATLTPEEKIAHKSIYPLYEDGATYSAKMANPYVVYPDYETGTLYKVIAKDPFVAQSAWVPDRAISLFTPVGVPDEIYPFGEGENGSIRNLSVNPYKLNDKITYNGYIWSSIIDNNVWSPKDYPQGWEREQKIEGGE